MEAHARRQYVQMDMLPRKQQPPILAQPRAPRNSLVDHSLANSSHLLHARSITRSSRYEDLSLLKIEWMQDFKPSCYSTCRTMSPNNASALDLRDLRAQQPKPSMGQNPSVTQHCNQVEVIMEEEEEEEISSPRAKRPKLLGW
mmetsp:Transcript_12747/g.21816  ORF Transcript_12747/g.21816 Transcript_12747/m.21816 type:complete len:143 (+) Transcript_12747:37-465(+)